MPAPPEAAFRDAVMARRAGLWHHPSVTSESDNKPRRGIYLLPNLLTTVALFAGFYSIVAAIDGNFVGAGIAVFIAMVMDTADGRVARLTNTQSDFGKEYDSLSDMVSFGLAPAVVVYQWGVARLTEYSITWGRVGWLVAFLYAVAAAMRLARFNSTPAVPGDAFFRGLPSPAAAGIVAGFVWLSASLNIAGFAGLALAFLFTAAAGLLMVSNFRFYSFKQINLGSRISFTYLLLVPAVLMLVSLNPPVVLASIFLSYAASGPLYWLFRDRHRLIEDADDAEEHQDE